MRWLPASTSHRRFAAAADSHAVAVVCALLTAATGAGLLGAQELTLDEAVRTALASNPEVLAASERANAAAARSDQARGYRLPRIDLAEVYSYTDNPSEVFAFQLNQERFDFDDFVMSDPNRPGPLTTWITRLELTQPIYTGGELSARIDQADSMASSEDRVFSHTRQRVAFDTIAAYVNLAKAREHLALVTKARNTTAEHLALAEAYSGQGLILAADVLKAKVFLAEMDELLEQARNRERLAEAALNFQLGADQSTPRALSGPPSPPPVSGDFEQWMLAALDRRHDLQAARDKLAAGRLEEKAARSGYLPEVAAVGRYELYDDGAFGDHGSSGSIMAVARINLFRGGSDRAAADAARHDTSSFEADIQRFEAGVRLEVQQAWHDLESARVRLDVAGDVLVSAREALRVREQRFRQGLDRMIDLLDAETALREAELRELVARYDVTLTSYRLIFVSGGTLIDSMEESS
jgi:outer membrane protein TolC